MVKILVVLSLLSLLELPCAGKPVVEKSGDIEIDWGRLRLRFYGEAEEKSLSFQALEKAALSAGIVMIKEKMFDYHKGLLIREGFGEDSASIFAQNSARMVATTTFVYNTEFHRGDKVRVYLENSLTRALNRSEFNFSVESPLDMKDSTFSGLILRSSVGVHPRSVYKVVDEGGAVLFGVKDVAKVAFHKNLMGRWLSNPTRSELVQYVGATPVSVQISKFDENGTVVVSGRAWKQALQDSKPILSNAKIVIVAPGPAQG